MRHRVGGFAVEVRMGTCLLSLKTSALLPGIVTVRGLSAFEPR
jgi:hypothetical protein